jgi:hypothetical protein
LLYCKVVPLPDAFTLVCAPFVLQTDEGEDDLKKGTQLLEIYALEIQMYTAQKNNKKLKTLYEQSLHIKSAIPHPLIMGVIRGECPVPCPQGCNFITSLSHFKLYSEYVIYCCSDNILGLCLDKVVPVLN